ncbi:hypothetical protein GT040_31215 [Streptomyces sp. SID2119]|nr:hypothetical protein [Streptomyces sp. SID2119]
MTAALVAFLRARLEDDERVARACAGDGAWAVEDLEFYAPDLSDEVRAHAALHDPARTLREVEAKRQLLTIHHMVEDPQEMQDYCAECDLGRDKYPY